MLINIDKETRTVVINTVENEEKQMELQANLRNSEEQPFTYFAKDWANCRQLRFKCLFDNKDNPIVVTNEWPSYLWPEGNILVSIIDLCH